MPRIAPPGKTAFERTRRNSLTLLWRFLSRANEASGPMRAVRAAPHLCVECLEDRTLLSGSISAMFSTT